MAYLCILGLVFEQCLKICTIMSGIWLESHMTKMTIWKLDIPQLDTLLQIQYEACPAQWGSGIQPFEMRKHFLSAFLRNCFLCWDCGNSDMPPTFDADLLCSSRAGSAIIPKIWKLDHSKSGSFCPDFKWCLTRWRPFVRISNGWASRFQIPFEAGPFATQPLFDHSKSRIVRISDPHWIWWLYLRIKEHLVPIL